MHIDLEAEKKEILRRYRTLLKSIRRKVDIKEKKDIRKAFEIAVDAHKEMRRKSGEPYIYHPIAVAQICVEEIGLGPTAVICGLLHDTVEDTEVTLNDIERQFGIKVARIIDGLTKISEVYDYNTSSVQLENFKKMLLTMSDDVRVILIKLADRLHNMRTLENMKRDKQLKIASETQYLYAPLAHRLGLNSIKTELEDLSLKFTEPEQYDFITQKLKDTEKERKKYITKFCEPLIESLDAAGIKYTIKGRPKSINSINNKIKKQGIPFENIYDIFAVRIIIDNDNTEETTADEKALCWKSYSIVTDHYLPSPDRLRDWVSTPKTNGYESLHTTVMGPDGKWVEVQIRTVRMDEIAEKGYAAHWKYKESNTSENALDNWIAKIRETLENPDSNALEFLDEFKLNLFAEEIFVFTPNGELRRLPHNATALDFAFEIHSRVGVSCIGAKVNSKLVPLSHVLKSGDQVEILTSKKQQPKEDWLKYVVTSKAKNRIREALRDAKKVISDEGKIIFDKKMKALNVKIDGMGIKKILSFYKVGSAIELYYKIAKNSINLNKLKDIIDGDGHIADAHLPKADKPFEQIVSEIRGSTETLVLGDALDKIDYKLSPCCNPIPGDDVFGFITIGEGIKIHRVSCPNAVQLLSNYAYRVVKAKWTSQESIQFLAGMKLEGVDDVGIVNNLTKIISEDLMVNMRSISFDTDDGIFTGKIMVYVHDTAHLDNLITKLMTVNGVHKVIRMDN
ncbi:MAG: bifunctional (p)ppGpp synthetase/guanosine-3',5'-bis(diphosphate) 3'-pyrophosphohydrolase [Bacteroidia bacterium]|nr:bifunctional (p)ppGpp synthetase/guanosine-3',5'-bis(diphosphate) 3'-pyrophosphohydrolase [Bacteroidia bacterium]